MLREEPWVLAFEGHELQEDLHFVVWTHRPLCTTIGVTAYASLF